MFSPPPFQHCSSGLPRESLTVAKQRQDRSGAGSVPSSASTALFASLSSPDSALSSKSYSPLPGLFPLLSSNYGENAVHGAQVTFIDTHHTWSFWGRTLRNGLIGDIGITYMPWNSMGSIELSASLRHRGRFSACLLRLWYI